MNDDKPIQGHEYDGIQEYDNPLPMWWLATFFGTIIFGFLYWIHYTTGAGPTLKQELGDDMAQVQQLQAKNAPKNESDEDLQKLAAAGGADAKGKEVFDAKCAVCHGMKLEGTIGPNLTDEYWIHGQGSLADIAKVVRVGVLDKGMPAWDTQLKPDEIQAVTVYVANAKGANPPNAKAPQGNKVGN